MTTSRRQGRTISHRTEPTGATYELRDGGRILVRPLLPSDREQLAAGYARLSPASRRSRFGSAAPEQLSPRRLDQLVDVGSDDRFALAAFALDEPGQPGVGVARYARNPHCPSEAEAAVVVLDEYQQRGIGAILLWDLVEVARSRGITTFTATVMWASADLLETLRSLGATVRPAEPGIAELRIALTDENRRLHRFPFDEVPTDVRPDDAADHEDGRD